MLKNEGWPAGVDPNNIKIEFKCLINGTAKWAYTTNLGSNEEGFTQEVTLPWKANYNDTVLLQAMVNNDRTLPQEVTFDNNYAWSGEMKMPPESGGGGGTPIDGFTFETFDATLEAVDADMTDQITAANKYIDPNINKYLPGSEVAVRIRIKPNGVKYERIQIKINLNAKNNSKIRIKDIVWSQKPGEQQPSERVEGEIMDPPDQEFAVYYTYKFEKVNPKEPLAATEKSITNDALIIPINPDGSVGTILKPSLEIKIRDAAVNLF
ncbi:MAG: hypothetical protein AB1510_13475 [Bacillota bacterium]